MPIMTPLTSNEQVYKYTLKHRLGGGHFGEVWCAHDQSIAKEIAVKIMSASDAEISDCIKEARTGHRMEHDNLVKVLYADIIERNTERLAIVAMDYLKDGTIERLVNSANFISIQTALPILCDILRGMEFLHDKNIFHNDIKPQNILIGPNMCGVLTDYGISAIGNDGQYVTAPNFYRLHAAPEILSSNLINANTDIYQFGLTMFRLLNGLGLLREKRDTIGQERYNQLVLSGDLITDKDYLPFIPIRLRRIIGKAIHIDPTQRYQSALSIRRDLEKLSFAGDWTVNSSGQYLGTNIRHEFMFAEEVIAEGRFSFTAIRKLKGSPHQRRIVEYCLPSGTRSEIEKIKKRYMQAVTTGGL